MKLSQVVRSGPGQYISEYGSLKYLAEKTAIFKRPMIITGKKSFAVFKKYYPGEVTWPVLIYDGSASNEDMARLATQAKEADVIIGIGGGRVLDTAKGTASQLNISVITIPTVAATCAAYTPLSAVYYPNHEFKTVDYYPRSQFLTLVDYQLLLDSPKDYLIAGIGDTLAKWYEARGILDNYSGEVSAMVRLGLAAAKETQQVLLHDTTAALAALDTGKISPEFTRVIDTVIGVAGTVGGFAGEYGRMAGAHAIHNALSYFNVTHSILHGNKVAYGILVQLSAMQQDDQIRYLLPFYRGNGFIYHLAGLGLKNTPETLEKIAEFAASKKESFYLVKSDISAAEIKRAIEHLEQLTE